MEYLENLQCCMISTTLRLGDIPPIDDGNDDINLEWTLSSLRIHWALEGDQTTSQ